VCCTKKGAGQIILSGAAFENPACNERKVCKCCPSLGVVSLGVLPSRNHKQEITPDVIQYVIKTPEASYRSCSLVVKKKMKSQGKQCLVD